MERKTLLAVAGLIVLGILAFAALRAPEKGQRVGEAPRPVAAFKAADVHELTITDEKQEKTVLVRDAAAKDSWRVTSPGDWPADGAAVKALVDGLEKMSFGDVITESTAKHDEMGVVEGKGQHVVARASGGKTLVDLYVGKALNGFTMVRPVGKSEVWQASGFYPYLSNKGPSGWRDHTVLEFAAADIDRLTVESGASKLVLEKEKAASEANPMAGAWKVVESAGDAPRAGQPLDAAAATGTLQAMANLKAADFADDKKADETGVEHPTLTVTAAGKGKTYALLLGATKGDDTYVKRGDAPSVYTVKKFALERIAHKPLDYRDKTLVKVPEADLVSVDVASGGGPTRTLSGDQLKPLAGLFADLQASGFAEDKDPARTGLAKPTAVVTVHLKDKSAVTLRIGAVNKDQADHFVQKAGSPDVMLVKKYVVDRLVKKPEAPGPPAGPGPAAPKTTTTTVKLKK